MATRPIKSSLISPFSSPWLAASALPRGCANAVGLPVFLADLFKTADVRCFCSSFHVSFGLGCVLGRQFVVGQPLNFHTHLSSKSGGVISNPNCGVGNQCACVAFTSIQCAMAHLPADRRRACDNSIKYEFSLHLSQLAAFAGLAQHSPFVSAEALTKRFLVDSVRHAAPVQLGSEGQLIVRQRSSCCVTSPSLHCKDPCVSSSCSVHEVCHARLDSSESVCLPDVRQSYAVGSLVCSRYQTRCVDDQLSTSVRELLLPPSQCMMNCVDDIVLPVCCELDSVSTFKHKFDAVLEEAYCVAPQTGKQCKASVPPLLNEEHDFSSCLSGLVCQINQNLAQQMIHAHHQDFLCSSFSVEIDRSKQATSALLHGRAGFTHPDEFKMFAPPSSPTRRAKAAAALYVATYNGNCWNTIKGFVLQIDAHIACAQEHKLYGNAIVEATLWAKKHGWLSFWESCQVTSHGGRSAGVCILVRSHLQAWIPDSAPLVAYKHRAIGVVVSAGGLGQLLVCSCYFHTSPYAKTKATVHNWHMLGKLISYIHEVNLPALVGADWNMEPHVVDATGLTVQAQVELLHSAGSMGTCINTHGAGPSNIDFFMCTKGLSDVIDEITICNSTSPKPHRPVYVRFAVKPRSLQALVVSEPKRIPTDPPFGPVVPPHDWGVALHVSSGLDGLFGAPRVLKYTLL